MHSYQLEHISFFRKIDPRYDTFSIDLFQVLQQSIPWVRKLQGKKERHGETQT
jgi:hypothetical protein